MQKTIFATVFAVCITNAAVAQKKSPPPSPPQPPAVEVVKFVPPVIVKDEDIDAFLKRNPGVKSVAWKNGHIITLTMKDKTIKTFNLEIEKMKKAFTEEFGEAPLPPPPPPPAPPVNGEE